MKERANLILQIEDEPSGPVPRAGLNVVWREHAAEGPASFPLSEQTFTIGRSEGNSLFLCGDDAASRMHAKVSCVGQHFVLTDLGSTNGTWVGGRRVTDHVLGEHDVIRVGNTLLCFAMNADTLARTEPRSLLAVGSSRMQALAERALEAQRARRVLLLRGEPGTGKEDIAQTLHRLCDRSGPLVKVLCSGPQLESRLFGDAGSATATPSLLMRADGGTLFFDDLADLELEAQAKLLQVLSERSYWPFGAESPRALDVGVICASARSLESMVQAGTFRADLYALLAACTLVVPPLRERREELGAWVDHFLSMQARPDLRVSVDFMDVLSRHDFPGNVRELAGLVKLSAALARDGVIEAKDLPEALRTLRSDEPTRPVSLRDSARALRARARAPLSRVAPS